jgi:hypothetical protein
MCHEDICGSGGIAPPFLTSALDWGERSAWSPCRFTPGERAPGGRVGPTAGLDSDPLTYHDTSVYSVPDTIRRTTLWDAVCIDNRLLNWYINIYCSCAEYTDQLEEMKVAGWRLITQQLSHTHTLTPLQSQSHIATDGQSVSQSWCRAPSGAHDQIFITCVTVTVLFLWGALSDEMAGLSFVYAAGLASAVFLGSESRGTRDHILRSQIWDFSFRRLLRLAGSRWKYSSPPQKVKVTLRLAVSQSVSQSWCRTPSGATPISIATYSYITLSRTYFL